MHRFREQSGESVHLSVWSGQRPVIVSRVDGQPEISLSIRIGFALPLDDSASGRVFAAFLPEAAQLAAQSKGRQDRAELQRILEEVRRSGLATSESLVNKGFAAISTPVFDHDGRVAAAMTALGSAAHLDTRPDGPVACALREAGETTSAALGWRPRLPATADRSPDAGPI